MATFKHTFDLGIFGEHTLPVTYTYLRGYPATREEPECEAEIDLDPIMFEILPGISLDLATLMTPDSYDTLIQACFDDYTECAIREAGERAQSRADAYAAIPD